MNLKCRICGSKFEGRTKRSCYCSDYCKCLGRREITHNWLDANFGKPKNTKRRENNVMQMIESKPIIKIRSSKKDEVFKPYGTKFKEDRAKITEQYESLMERLQSINLTSKEAGQIIIKLNELENFL